MSNQCFWNVRPEVWESALDTKPIVNALMPLLPLPSVEPNFYQPTGAEGTSDKRPNSRLQQMETSSENGQAYRIDHENNSEHPVVEERAVDSYC